MSTQKPAHGYLQQLYSLKCQNLEAIQSPSVGEQVHCATPTQRIIRQLKDELLSHKTSKNLKCILLSEGPVSKAKYYMIPTLWHSGKGKN